MTAHRSRIGRYLDEHRPATPCLVVDVDEVGRQFDGVRAALPDARVLYAVKANPAFPVLRRLVDLGAGFDVAGPAEIELCLAAGAHPEQLSYGNPIKKPADIADAWAAGVREFVTDAADDVDALAEHAPGAQVSVRLLVDAPASVTPFGRKFGCAPAVAVRLVKHCAAAGLDPVGVGFHVGSQQLRPTAWDTALGAASGVFDAAASAGIQLRAVNLGGGFAVRYRDTVPALADYARAIHAAMAVHFPGGPPEVTIEPGRLLVAPAGVLRSSVVLVARKDDADSHRWVYLDVGRYNGLAETENEAIAYRLSTVRTHAGADGPVILAGPTCDGDDVLYQRTPYRLPLDLRGGDLLDIEDAGAYTASYSSVGFNGIAPLPTICLEGGSPVDDH